MKPSGDQNDMNLRYGKLPAAAELDSNLGDMRKAKEKVNKIDFAAAG
jgi:hypothetical protein